MSATSQTILLGIFTLASSIWIGGYVAIAVVARVVTRTLEPGQRVRFFRALGRSYLLVGAPALVIALGTGAGLVSDHAWDGTLLTTIVISAALLVSLVAGVLQARRMTRLRAADVVAPEDPQLTSRVVQGARVAVVLRAAIGLFSLALIALGSLLAT